MHKKLKNIFFFSAEKYFVIMLKDFKMLTILQPSFVQYAFVFLLCIYNDTFQLFSVLSIKIDM